MKVAVIGAGIVGSACAYAAAGLGAEVIMVDAGLPGRATAAGAGIICPWTAGIADPAWHALAAEAARHYPALIAELADELGRPAAAAPASVSTAPGGCDVSYRRVGALYLAGGDQLGGDILGQARDRMLARRTAAPEIGDVEILTAGQARELFPPLAPGREALYIGGAARVDGAKLTAALAEAAVRRGVQIMTGKARLAGRSGQVSGVTVDGQLIEADAVVAAAGAWTAAFAEPAGVTIRVRPERGQIAHISVGAADTSRWPVVLPSGSGHYLLGFDDSRVVVGATREPAAGLDARLTAGGVHEVLSEALAVAPGLRDGTLIETRVGLRPAGPDARPLLGPVAGVRGLVIATGLGASGLTLGPLAGAIAARAALGLDNAVDLAPFDPVR